MVDAGDSSLNTQQAMIADSVFFDEAYYRGQLASSLAAGMSPAKHYLNEGWRLGLDPGPLFSTLRYLWRNEDVRRIGINPLLHYLQYGLKEGRRPWSSPEVMRWQSPWFNNPQSALAETEQLNGCWPRLVRGDRVFVYTHSKGHFVFHQFQQMLVQAFQDIGINAIAADEKFYNDHTVSVVSLVLAPHDFFFLPGSPEFSDKRFAQAILINTEQMPSRWFARIMPLLFQARHVLDMNVQTAASLCRLGINARFLPMGFVPENEIFKTLAMSQLRDIDLLWVGSNSKRRYEWFNRHQAILSKHQSLVRLVGVVGALDQANPDAIGPMQYATLARRTKIHLNIHHFNMPYFEWQRIVHYGLMQGNCVVTETSPRVPGLQPGEHYLEADKDQLPELVDWLLSTSDGQKKLAKVSQAGQQAAIKTYKLSTTLADLFEMPAAPIKS